MNSNAAVAVFSFLLPSRTDPPPSRIGQYGPPSPWFPGGPGLVLVDIPFRVNNWHRGLQGSEAVRAEKRGVGVVIESTPPGDGERPPAGRDKQKRFN